MDRLLPALPVSRTLDGAGVVARVTAPDNLVWQDDHLLFSSGHDAFVMDGVGPALVVPEPILHFEAAVTALAGAPDGSLAVGLGSGGIRIVGGARDGLGIMALGGQPLRCPTALCFATPDQLFVCQGAADGSVWPLGLASAEAVCLGAGLAFPNGVLLRERAGRIAVCEAGRRRLLGFDAVRSEAPEVLCDVRPAIPAA